MSDLMTAVFKNAGDAAIAINDLELKGINEADISLVASENATMDSFGISENSKMPEGAAVGAVSGGLVTALVAGMTTVGALATGGLGLLASGPLVAALAGAGAGATAGTIIGGAIGATIPEHEVKFYEDALSEGSVLLGIKYNDESKEMIENILKANNADKISS